MHLKADIIASCGLIVETGNLIYCVVLMIISTTNDLLFRLILYVTKAYVRVLLPNHQLAFLLNISVLKLCCLIDLTLRLCTSWQTCAWFNSC